ncbi:MAG: magnesium transporter [Synergistaceae bacterium]|jgi:magnesium transporter|nr:magnesium transporter [Synergistaceae bacterium]
MTETIATETIADLIGSKKHRELKARIAETNTIDLAEELEKLGQEQRVVFFRSLPKDAAADIFSYLSPETKENLIELLTDPELAHIVNDLFLDDAVDFIEEMPANVVKRVLKNASDDTRKQINQLLQYQEDSAGSIMTTEYIDLKEEMTVEDAFRRIRQVGVDKETVYTCYVTDARRVLDGVVTIRKLLLSQPTDRIGGIMTPNVISVNTGDDREHAAELFQKYDLVVLPVVDTERHLVGIITVDDAMEVLEEENTEDFQIMAAMEPSDEPYLSAGVFELAKRRILWLLILMVSAFFTGGIITRYEHLFAAFPALIAAIPMLMDTGGNAGSQSSTLIIRGMAVGELGLSDWCAIFWKELRVSALVGVILGIVNVAYKWFLSGNPTLALTVGASLCVTVIFAKLIGCMLPLLAKMLRFDPALMAAPIVTTIVDAGGLFVYFCIAEAVMR